MQQYLDLLYRITKEGTVKPSGRKGMPDTISVFGHQMRFDLREGFPINTTKKVNFKNIVVELLWFLAGSTNIKYLVDNGCNIWNKDAYRWYKKTIAEINNLAGESDAHIEEYDYDSFVRNIGNELTREYTIGDLGPVYGKQWREWEGFRWVLDSMTNTGYKPFETDQIKNLVDGLRANPYGRRHIVSAWNPADMDNMALPPCHILFQFQCEPMTVSQRFDVAAKNLGHNSLYFQNYIDNHSEGECIAYLDSMDIPTNYLNCMMFQRSVDTFLGLPYNITSYSLLLEIISNHLGMTAKDFVWVGADTHIYDNHMDAVKTQISRKPKNLPKLSISCDLKNIELSRDLCETIKPEDFTLLGYNPDDFIKAEMSAGDE